MKKIPDAKGGTKKRMDSEKGMKQGDSGNEVSKAHKLRVLWF